MVVHPAPAHWTGTFVNALLHHLTRSNSAELPDGLSDPLRPGVVHRLDRYTSGVLLAAKTSTAQRALLASLKRQDCCAKPTQIKLKLC